MLRRLLVMTVLAFALALFGCDSGSTSTNPAQPGDGSDDETVKPETDGKDVAKADRWNYTNDPARFQIQFEKNYDALVEYTEGEAEQLPWPSDYWATYEDSTNVRFHGNDELSAVEKYDAAFNGWETDPALTPLDTGRDCDRSAKTWKDTHADYYAQLGPAAKWQHENKGMGRMIDGRDNDNDGETDECGGEDYDGVETWWGLCHAWTPAAILEPEPRHEVTYNGVTFTVSDIKALLITMYDRSSARMLGARCNDKEVKRDEFGRVEKDACRDTNAGSWHVVATNMLGMQRRAFAMDRTHGYQVWNQPVLGYEIREQTEVTEEDAMKKLGREGEKYQDVFDSPEAVRFVYVRMIMHYITEASSSVDEALTSDRDRYDHYVRDDDYRYILEIDKDGDIVGGEWLPNSDEFPDFLWLPIRGNGGNPKMSLGNVRMLLDLSRKTDEPEPTGDLVIKTYGGDELNLEIPDNDSVGISRTLEVPDDIEIGSLKVSVEIKHTYIGDLLVTLTHDGKKVTLHDRTGGSQDDIEKTYELSDFNAVNAGGDWELAVSDHAGQDIGKLVRWSLTVGTEDTSAPASNVVERSAEITTPIDIPDNDEDGIVASLTVDATGTVDKLEVTVDLTHTYIGDLEVALVHGQGMQILHSREGGSADDIKKTYTVEGFRGAPVKGVWELMVIDHARADKGTLNTFTLKATLQ